jgi:cytochrome c2
MPLHVQAIMGSLGLRIRIVQVTWLTLLALMISGCAAARLTAAPAARRVPGGDPGRGEQAIVDYGCGACHAIPGVPGANGKVGPSLDHLAERQVIAGRLPNTPTDLEHWIQDPQGVSPGTAMPYMGVTDNDAADIAAYLYEQH